MRTLYACFFLLTAFIPLYAQDFYVSDNKPAYVDSIWYGSADPTIVWNPVKKEYYMYYTQRRATIKGDDWPEGSSIGIAASKDGRQWRYVDICCGERLENPVQDDYSLWAPSVIYHKKKFHMYVTYVPGITGKFGKGISYIKHYTGKDGVHWNFESFIPLSSDDCIDPCVYKVGKTWQMIYKDEAHTWAAESKDLYHWKVRGPIIEDIRHEAPFYWKQNGRHFIIVDAWKNLSRVYESPNGLDGWEYITSFEAGHPAILQANGKTFLIYHKHEINFPRGTGIFVDELVIDKDGKPAPLTTIQEIKKEVHPQDTLYFHVKAYGAKGDGVTDDFPALSKVFRQVSRAQRPSKIVFESQATYLLNKHSEDEYSRLMLNHATHVTVEGNGSLLLVHPSNRAFGVYRSGNIIIRNFQIDYSPLPYTQGRITRIDNHKGYLEFWIDEGYPLPLEGDSTYYTNDRHADSITANGDDLKFYQGHSRISAVTKLDDRLYAVTYRKHRFEKARTGDYFCMKIEYPQPPAKQNTTTQKLNEKDEYIVTGDGSILAMETSDILLENITSFASPVMTVLMKGCSRHVIHGLNMKRKPGRIVAGCSDGIHLKGNEYQPVIENSYIEGTMDDAIHIKISGDVITEVETSNKVRIRHMDIIWDNTNLGAGKEVMVFDPETNSQLAMCRIIHYEPINYREGRVTLDKKVSEMKVGTCLYLQAEGEAIIRHCGFGTQLQRAILTHQPTYVHDCIIEDNGKGFDLGLASVGIEGPPTQRLKVERCLFRNLSWVGVEIFCPSLNYDQKGIPQVIVKDCQFDLPDNVPALIVKNSTGLSLINNRFGYLNNPPEKNKYIRLENTRLIEDTNNRFEKGWTGASLWELLSPGSTENFLSK